MEISISPSSDPSSFGHHFHVNLNSTSLDDTDIRVLETLRPIGVQVTNKNFLQDKPYEEWLEKYKKLIEDVHKRTGHEKMFVTIDHEGGRVHRTPQPFTHFPTAFEYAQHATEVAKSVAKELGSIGINLLFGPCADIHSNPNNPVIGQRAFDTDPIKTAKHVVDFFQALEANGIVACIKHFPGHGDTLTDSHFDLPTLNHNYESLKKRELIPFKEAINEKISSIMTAHILFPEFDKDTPATLSPRILKKVLREDLGFEGMIITDDLDMKAIKDNYSIEQIAHNSLLAGCDLLLFNHEPLRAIDIAKEFFTLYKNGTLSEELLLTSKKRIHTVLNKCKDSSIHKLDSSVFKTHRELKDKIKNSKSQS